MKFIISGIPCVLRRHRHTKLGRTYNSQRSQMDDLAFMVKSQWNKKPFQCPLKLSIVFHTPIPKSFSKKKALLLNNTFDTRHRDLSNYIKFLEDSLNGVVWEDDSIIVELNAQKKYSINPRTEFEVTGL